MSTLTNQWGEGYIVWQWECPTCPTKRKEREGQKGISYWTNYIVKFENDAALDLSCKRLGTTGLVN